jgi:hypothetical protein
MKKYIFLLSLILIGCDTPKKNKEEIEHIKNTMVTQDEIQEINNRLNNQYYKLEQLEQKINKIKLNQNHNDINNDINNTQNSACKYKLIKPTTFITIKEVNVYNKPEINSSIVLNWDECITFTSYKEKNGFVKVTGYFVDGKWRPNHKEWWIKKCDIKVKKIFK